MPAKLPSLDKELLREGRGKKTPPVLCPSLHSFTLNTHSASKQSYLSIYHSFMFSATYLNSSVREPIAMVSWIEPRVVKLKRKRLLQGQIKVSSHGIQDLTGGSLEGRRWWMLFEPISEPSFTKIRRDGP